jgi:hypothetical protein
VYQIWKSGSRNNKPCRREGIRRGGKERKKTVPGNGKEKFMWVNRPKTERALLYRNNTNIYSLNVVFILSETGVYQVLNIFLGRGKIWGKRNKGRKKEQKRENLC